MKRSVRAMNSGAQYGTPPPPIAKSRSGWRRTAVQFAVASVLFAGRLPGQIGVPQPGIAHFPDGSVRVIRGVPANLLVGSKPIASADAISFSDAGGLTSLHGLIRLLRVDGTVIGEYQSTEEKPILNIGSSLRTAAAWLPSAHSLLRWDGAQFAATPIHDSAFGGPVSYLEIASDAIAQFFVSSADSTLAKVSVALPSGQLLSSDIQPGVRGKTFLQHGWLLWQNEWGLTAEQTNGTHQTMVLSSAPLPTGDLSIERMSDDWLHVFSQSTGTNWAILFTATKVTVSLLPPPTQEAAQ